MSESKDKNFLIYCNFHNFSDPNDLENMCLNCGWTTAELKTRRESAIHLKVPMSGTVWLDEMIEASRRDEFAKAAMQAYLTRDVNLDLDDDTRAAWSLDQADALLAVSNKRKEGE
jgi:hypothetical protein